MILCHCVTFYNGGSLLIVISESGSRFCEIKKRTAGSDFGTTVVPY